MTERRGRLDLGNFSSILDHRPYTVAVVGAASGIGRATAEYLAELGIRVVCVDRDGAGVQAVRDGIAAAGGSALAAVADVVERDAVELALAHAVSVCGQVHGLVNCAGITGTTNLKAHEVDLDEFDHVYRVNLRGAMVLSKAVLPHFLERGFGRLVHVASIAGKEGNAGMAAYSATKAGLIGLVKSLAKDYAETGVTVNGVAPAVIRTPLVEALPDATVKYMTDKIPMKRCGELSEIAAMIAWILSPACSFTTGFTFDLSGGRATY